MNDKKVRKYDIDKEIIIDHIACSLKNIQNAMYLVDKTILDSDDEALLKEYEAHIETIFDGLLGLRDFYIKLLNKENSAYMNPAG